MTRSGSSVLVCPERLVCGASSLSGHAGRPRVEAVLVQNHRNDLSAHVALEGQLRVDNLVKELVLGAREDGEGGLPRDLRFETIGLERDFQYTEIAPVPADVVAERDGVERDFAKLGRKLRRIELWGRTVAVLVQYKSIDQAPGIALEAYADSESLGEELVGR